MKNPYDVEFRVLRERISDLESKLGVTNTLLEQKILRILELNDEVEELHVLVMKAVVGLRECEVECAINRLTKEIETQ